MTWGQLHSMTLPLDAGHVIMAFLIPVLIKYSVNIINLIEDLQKANYYNWYKDGAVLILSALATQMPFLQPYLPQLTPLLQTFFLAVMTNLSHHAIELLVNLSKGTNLPSQNGLIGGKK